MLVFCLSTNPLFPANSQPSATKSTVLLNQEKRTLQISQLPELATAESNANKTSTSLINREIMLSYAVLSFGILVIFLEFYLIKSVKNKIEPPDILLVFTITLILVGTLFLIASGHTSQQIALVLGLFGTIIGYLLGRETEKLFDRKVRGRNSDIE